MKEVKRYLFARRSSVDFTFCNFNSPGVYYYSHCFVLLDSSDTLFRAVLHTRSKRKRSSANLSSIFIRDCFHFFPCDFSFSKNCLFYPLKLFVKSFSLVKFSTFLYFFSIFIVIPNHF